MKQRFFVVTVVFCGVVACGDNGFGGTNCDLVRVQGTLRVDLSAVVDDRAYDVDVEGEGVAGGIFCGAVDDRGFRAPGDTDGGLVATCEVGGVSLLGVRSPSLSVVVTQGDTGFAHRFDDIAYTVVRPADECHDEVLSARVVWPADG